MTAASPRPVAAAHRTYAGLAEQEIRAMLVSGQLRAGERINEVEIAQALGISRGPLREAIQRLASEGLLVVKNHRGTFVAEFSATDLRELYDLRLAIELFSIRLGANRGDDAKGDYEELLQRNLEYASGRNLKGARPDFHRRIVEATGNKALVSAHDSAMQKIALARERTVHDEALVQKAAAHHVTMLENLLAGKVAAAIRAHETHLLNSLDETLTVFENG